MMRRRYSRATRGRDEERARGLRRSLCVAAVCVLVAVPVGAQSNPPSQKPPASNPAPGTGAQPAGEQDLSSQATDPTASLMSINFISDFKISHWGIDESGYEFRFQPAIPFRIWGANNIMRVIVPYQGSGPGDEGLKNVSLFDIVIIPQKWGRLAVGPVMNFVESSSQSPSKFAIGPAVGFVIPRSRRLNYGLFSQNLFGNDVGITQLQPILAYQLGHGWALSAGDLQFTYDWARGEWANVPFGFQLGVVRPIAGQPFRFSINPQWNLKDLDGAEKAKIVFTVTLLVPSR